MMRVRAVVGNSAMVCLAVAAGWWLHDAGKTVLAQRSSSSSSSRGGDANLAFQLVENGSELLLTVYNPENHTLYIYPHVAEGNSHISCVYSFTIPTPGRPIDRQVCPLSSLLP